MKPEELIKQIPEQIWNNNRIVQIKNILWEKTGESQDYLINEVIFQTVSLLREEVEKFFTTEWKDMDNETATYYRSNIDKFLSLLGGKKG